jgi:hypothetical protein
MRKKGLSILLAILMVLGTNILPSQAIIAANETVLQYDSGVVDVSTSRPVNYTAAVRFSPTYTSSKITEIQFYIGYCDSWNDEFRIHVLDSEKNEWPGFTPFNIKTEMWNGWKSIDLSSFNIVVSGDFYVGLEWVQGNTPGLGFDNAPDGTNATGRSYFIVNGGWWPAYVLAGYGEWLVRAGIEEVIVDEAPNIASNLPTNGSTNIPVNSDITITFSEPVNVSGSWYSIVGSISGMHTANVSGGPTSFILNPDIDFIAGETCTITVYASNVSDQDIDDPPDNMTEDFIFSFSTTGGTGPTTAPEVGGDIYPVSKVGMLLPLVGSAIILISTTAILIWRRRRVQS